MALTRAQKYLEAPRLPVELLTEIAKLAPKSSLWALCRTSRVFHELTVRELYRYVTIHCTGVNDADTKDLVCRAQKWCQTVMDKPDKAAFVESVTISELPSDLIEYDPAQAFELIALLKRAFKILPNLESLDVDCSLNPLSGSLGILDALRVPSLRTFRIEMDSDNDPTLIDFLSKHPRLKNIELMIDGFDDAELEEELTLPELERFTAPFTYWEALRPNPNLRFAGVHQDRFRDLDYNPFDVMHPLGKFTGVKSVWILIPSESTLPYLNDLKEELPMLEQLSVEFSNWNDRGEAVTTSLSVATCLAHFKSLKYVSVEADNWNHKITQNTAMTLAEESSKHCDTLLRARFGQWNLKRDRPSGMWRIV
ncbi:uncharacterized protein STEHIDRAFT_143359 [Stereum hirsutum FP-91666 SS1]|uniref:uncharacterized protein n=1 Tax=Stereum hirsutum (strain FP-91666) TaxID=721885 RepID=UPI000440E660|nr:uncharacterized protein STEHIDRAFT_143359 [Stereum hirsutum FP-91666 SS1]EIM91755.1 hypothetical protein STEHIDRAFT_143359 [Stereum hirsutum FP-91666 SS1]